MSELSKRKSTIVIIPAYEPPRALIEYAKTLINKGFGGIVVVNDGSNEKYSPIFEELSEIDGCTVISYSENHGKGYALKTAFKYCRDNYDEEYVFVTADCDGQHLAKDVERVANSAAEHSGKLILGARDFSLDYVPARSRAGNVNIRKMFKFFYGLSLSDTQTGLRAFSYSLLDKLISIKGDRFEYEMNMLIVFHKAHIQILEVPIETVYEKKPDDVDKVSHFKTFSDSMRVMMTLFQNLGWYLVSSLLSAVIDIVAFFFLANYLPFTRNVLFATIGARILSSIVNFTINFKVVFNGRSKQSIVKYYVLWTAQLGASYGFATLWNYIFTVMPVNLSHTQINLLTTLLKGICDILLALLSYQIQSRWVFVTVEHSRLHFYGIYFRFVRLVYNIFHKQYQSYVIPDEKEPAIYVAKHLNMRGCHRILQNVSFDFHVYAMHEFFSFSSSYKHYSTYTFTKKLNKKGLGKFFGKIKAFFCALAVVPGMRSAKAVPVYRGGNDSVITFRKTMKYLSKRENVLLFPDIDYTSDSQTESDIYTGFLYLDKLYYKKFKQHIAFKVLNVNEEKRSVNEVASIRFPDGVDFTEAMPDVADKIREALSVANL